MKKKSGFVLRQVCGENVIVAEGKENIDFSSIIAMNESSAYLWNKIREDNFTPETMATMLTEEYEIDNATALADATTLANQWMEAGIIE